jgi:hypothetical protein
MLANRADVYNLGEIIGDTADVFEMSYLENSLTSNPILNKLASRSQKDVYSVIKIAETDEREGAELEGNYSSEELNEMVAVIKKLFVVRDVILSVNREYIRSAAMADEYRTEPPFKLQGSYRNMNRIAEKVVPIMNDKELQTLIVSNYENDAQTLTSDNEANMLKFKELMGILTPQEKNRWEHIKSAYTRGVKMKGVDTDDKFGQLVVQLSTFSDGLESIRRAMSEGVTQLAETKPNEEGSSNQISALIREIGTLKSGLESIGGVLNTGVQQMLEMSEKTRLAPAPSGNGGVSPEQFSELVAALQASAAKPSDARPAPPLPPQKVIVQHKVPQVVFEVVKAQFELMQSWLAPILAAENMQSTDIQQLQKSIDTCLNSYAALVEELEEAKQQRLPAKKTR